MKLGKVINFVFEPPGPITNSWHMLIKTIIEKYCKLFKTCCIYFYELPCGYKHHQEIRKRFFK